MMAKQRKKPADALQTSPDATEAQEATCNTTDAIKAEGPTYNTTDALEALAAKYNIPPDAEAQGPKHIPYNPDAKHLYNPADNKVGYWDDPDLPERLEQDWNREYGPDENLKFLLDFTRHIFTFAFEDEWASVWTSLPKDENSEAPELHSKRDLVFKERRWLENALERIEPLVKKHGENPRPFIWFGLYICGIEPLIDNYKRELRFLLVILLEAEKGERDAEPSGSPEYTLTGEGGEGRTYLAADLMNELDVSSTTLNKYAKAAGVPTPGRGKSNHRYTSGDRTAILKHIVEHGSEVAIVARGRELLPSEIEAKSNNRS